MIGGMIRLLPPLLFTAALAHIGAAWAQAPEPVETLEVTTTRITVPWIESPSGIGVVDANALIGEPGLALDEALERIPGLYPQSTYNLNQGLRLSIRGFGSRAAFGVRGIRVYVDDVPLTMPDGQTDLDALDLALLERVEVLRGPSSALYGNGAGGVVSVTTRDQPAGQFGRVDATVGEFGERRLRGEVGGSTDTVSGLVSVAHRELDGHRDNMAADSLIGSGRVTAQLGAGTLAVSLATLDIDAEDPAALTRAELAMDRSLANPGAVNFAVRESIRQERLGAIWRAPLGETTDYRLRGWAGERDFANRLPFAGGGQTAFERQFAGVGTQLNHRLAWGPVAQTVSVGADVETQRDARQRFDNSPGGVRGDETLSQDERARGAGAYVSNRLVWGRTLADVGIRYDRVRLSVNDAFVSDGDDSGRREFNRVSGNVGLGYQLSEHDLLFVRYGTGFETPANNELANPAGGGFNPALGPSAARNVELGIKRDTATLRAELVVYRIRNDDELVRFELDDQPGRSFFRNAGITDRDGVEASLSWDVAAPLTATLVYSYNDFRFRRYQLGADDFAGNEIPGIPNQQLFAELALRPAPAWTAKLQVAAQGRLFANDANTERVAGYVTSHARLAWTGRFAAATVSPYVALNNIFDTEYHDNIRANASFGRFFEPAPGRVLCGGVSITF
jgi:iron complex outermembrane recepter protein